MVQYLLSTIVNVLIKPRNNHAHGHAEYYLRSIVIILSITWVLFLEFFITSKFRSFYLTTVRPKIYYKKELASFPIKSLEDLKSKAYAKSPYYEFIKASIPLPLPNTPNINERKLLVCHDMKNGYLDDRFVQGGKNVEAYTFWHWPLIDIFVYFSHNLITVPPVSWINAGHKHGVKEILFYEKGHHRIVSSFDQVLGTFLMEGTNFLDPTCQELLASEENALMYAKLLAELAKDIGFDGWLINVELIFVPQFNILKKFVSYLTEEMHSAVPGSLVIWYEAVTVFGVRIAQNQLNILNKSFFDRCDGIFTNYGWKENYPKMSAEVAGDRKYDVYMGIDVFGRHDTYGGGKWNISVALDVVKKANVSAAIFAPGWVHETNQLPDFQTAENLWWQDVRDAWEVSKLNPKPLQLPLYSNFDQGRGYNISVEGRQVISGPWNSLSSQGFQPDLEFKNTDRDPIKAVVNLERESYSGGGNVAFVGKLEDSSTSVSTIRLFRVKLHLTEPLHLTYSVKLKGNSQLGMYFLMEDGSKVLVAPSDKSQFSGSYDDVIKPDESEREKWVIRECKIDKNGKVLREIHVLCYKDSNSAHNSAEYDALLGHITLKSYKYKSSFPPPNYWDVQFDHKNHHQELSKCSSNNKNTLISVRLGWKLIISTSSSASGSDPQFSHYNVYVVRQTNESSGGILTQDQEKPQYIGVAFVKGFYVSKLSVPSTTASLKFIVQVCGLDGACQPLNDSPYGILKFDATHLNVVPHGACKVHHN